MPGLVEHQRVVNSLYPELRLCYSINKLVDDLTDLGQSGEAILKHYFLFGDKFPVICRYIYDVCGSECVKCLVLHAVTDYVYELIRGGLGRSLIEVKVRDLMGRYLMGCMELSSCRDFSKVLQDVATDVLSNLDRVIEAIEGSAGIERGIIDGVVNASTDIIYVIIQGNLYVRGTHINGGPLVGGSNIPDYRVKTLASHVKTLLSMRLSGLVTQGIVRDLSKLLDTINLVRNEISLDKFRPIHECLTVIKDVMNKYQEFKLLIDVINECVDEVFKLHNHQVPEGSGGNGLGARR